MRIKQQFKKVANGEYYLTQKRYRGDGWTNTFLIKPTKANKFGTIKLYKNMITPKEMIGRKAKIKLEITD